MDELRHKIVIEIGAVHKASKEGKDETISSTNNIMALVASYDTELATIGYRGAMRQYDPLSYAAGYNKGYKRGSVAGRKKVITLKELEKNREATDSTKPVKSNERTTDHAEAGSEPEGKPNE